jgi:chromatin assembly factor 1 subunit A
LDAFISGEITVTPQPFTGAACVDYFCLPSVPKPRGRPYPSVRKIISILSDASSGSPSVPIDLTSDSRQVNTQATRSARELLKEVPMKYLCFFQDVRPDYYGTVSSTPPSSRSLHRLARNPISRDVLPLQYDYDSEAEWVDDGDGEDIDDLDDEEEDHADEDEDMADFLDDSEDIIKRPVFASGMEPESSGLCFEDRKRLGPSDQMYKFRMEFILGKLSFLTAVL